MRVDRGSIEIQLHEIGESDRWWEQREFRELPHVLRPEERILGLANGMLLTSRRVRLAPARRWLFVVTSQRLICLRQHRLARSQIDLLPDQLTRVRQRTGLRMHQVRVETEGRTFRLRIRKDEVLRFAAALEQLIPSPVHTILPSDLEPLSWIPGIGTVAGMPLVGGIVTKVAMLSPPDHAAENDVQRLEHAVERLQTEVAQLRQQVSFLEDLLQTKTEASYLPPFE